MGKMYQKAHALNPKEDDSKWSSSAFQEVHSWTIYGLETGQPQCFEEVPVYDDGTVASYFVDSSVRDISLKILGVSKKSNCKGGKVLPL